MRAILAMSVAAFACVATWGCVRTPMADAISNVSVDEVVRRLKCELMGAVNAKRHEDPRFEFLTQWAVKVHLTLVVDDQAAINPGATFVEPLSIAGTSRSLAIGAGLTTQAIRTEDIEFFLSISEMIGEMSTPRVLAENYDYCRRDFGVLLESELGLKAVMDKALSPVAAGVLYTGQNNPGLGSGQPKIPSGEAASIRRSLQQLANFEKLAPPPLSLTELNASFAGKRVIELERPTNESVAESAAEAKKRQDDRDKLRQNLAKAKQLEADTRMLIRDVVTPLQEIAASTVAGKCQDDIAADRIAAVASASVVSIKKYGIDNTDKVEDSTKLLEEQKKAAKQVYDRTQGLLTKIITCGPRDASKPSLYDPIDLISETVNFYVTATGSLTPSWKLVRIVAPLAPNLLSGTRKNTNTLIFTMGRPATSGDTIKPSTAMEQQILAQLLSQAITTRLNQ